MRETARSAALHALERCRSNGAWSGAAIDSEIKKAALDGRDGALAAALCLGVLENKTLCDFYISAYCSVKLNRIEPGVLDILRLGVCQILFMDKIPDSAAVNESVSLARQEKLDRAAGLINAVLRRVAENKNALPEIPGRGSGEYLSLRYSHPRWLADRLIAEKGYDFAEAFFRANNSRPRLDVQINTLKISEKDYLSALADTEYSLFEGLNGCFQTDKGSPADLPGFGEGLIYVQDMAARMTCEIAGGEKGMNVLDCCAAPGGKSFSTAVRMGGEGHILSCDIHEKKLALIQSGAARLGIGMIDTRCMDASVFDPELENAFDLVIADVPCSGMGVIRKKPEIRDKRAEDIARLPEVQSRILRNVCRYVRPGGVLVYSTCTVLDNENSGVAEQFLREHSEFAAEDFTVGPVRSQNGMHTFWPHVEGTDGFFAAKFRRKD